MSASSGLTGSAVGAVLAVEISPSGLSCTLKSLPFPADRQSVLRAAILSLTLLSSTVALAFAGVAAAQPTTKRLAELDVLRATKILARWHVAAIDSRTQTLRSNTIVRCAGRGHYTVAKTSGARRYLSFICTLQYRRESVRMLYTAGKGRHFSLERLPHKPSKGSG